MPKLTTKALREHLPDWGVLVLESHHAPEFVMDWRSHSFLKVVYVLSGEGTFHFSNSSSSFSAGDVIVVPPETRNRIEDNPGSASSLYICCVSTALLTFDPMLTRRFTTKCFNGEQHLSNRAAALMRRMVHAQERRGDEQPIAMVGESFRLLELVLKQYRPTVETKANKERSPDREAVSRYYDSLPREFFDATTIDAAAAELQMSRRKFTKLFAEVAGETWLKSIRRLAIQHATTRLSQTELPIMSIAFECGFRDLSTFYRQFKSQVGMPPSEYRKRI